jgi:hypothetical protein
MFNAYVQWHGNKGARPLYAELREVCANSQTKALRRTGAAQAEGPAETAVSSHGGDQRVDEKDEILSRRVRVVLCGKQSCGEPRSDYPPHLKQR